jgi:hypothetical protein
MSGSTPSPAVQMFLTELAVAQKEISGFRLSNSPDPTGSDTKRLEVFQESAKDELDALQVEVDSATAGQDQDELARENTRQIWRVVGNHSGKVQQLDGTPFTIRPIMSNDYVSNIILVTRDNVPIRDDAGLLKTEIDAAVNVITSVMSERLRVKYWFYPDARRKAILESQNDYLEQMQGLAEVGLESTDPTRIKFARTDLDRLKELFKLREAGVIKNSYLMRLAIWSAIAAILFIAAYFWAREEAGCANSSPQEFCRIWYELRNFHLLAAGTAIGTWLSFSLRRQELAFTDLAVLEPDRLDPPARVVFMIGLSGLLGLLLFSGAITAGVGGVTGHEGLHLHGSWALLIGLLAGIAERALGTAVTRRGVDFATVIGGDGANLATTK